jgi:hypothetical protein
LEEPLDKKDIILDITPAFFWMKKREKREYSGTIVGVRPKFNNRKLDIL